jgi:hypothetical protein
MIDRDFYEKQLAKYRQDQATYQAMATMTTDAEAREFYQRQADRAAAYAADYEQDLAK